jgi:malonyl CoA-acyl carrier protein transacylase
MKAYVFPGQGSQFKGMGKELFDGFESLLSEADDILGYSIRELCLHDPRERLGLTQYTQPALFTVNAVAWLKQRTDGVVPDYLAGHSLGEYNALLAAGAFDFGTGLKLVKKRGELMAAAPRGAMAAVVRSPIGRVQEVLRAHGLEALCIANHNSPSQFVVSGLVADIDRAIDVFTAEGLVAVKLNAGGAFHSPYMEAASREFAAFMAGLEFRALKLPVIANVDARPYRPGQVAAQLARQIAQPVRWTDSVRYLLAQGEMEFLEIGPGRVLTKLVKDIRDQAGPMTEAELTAAPPAQAPATPPAPAPLPRPAPEAPRFDREALLAQATRRIDDWNRLHPPGTRVNVRSYEGVLETRTAARLLFGHRAAIYLHGYNGYFDLDDVSAASAA